MRWLCVWQHYELRNGGFIGVNGRRVVGARSVLMLHIVEALVQAYIFGTLALIYIAGGMQSHETDAIQEASPPNNKGDKT